MKIALLLILACFSCSGTTWYVRPIAYGASDGTSYNNAWGNIHNINWSKVSSGDTIYVCGTNIFTATAQYQIYVQTKSTIGASGITIRGDYAGDPGLICGAVLQTWATTPWHGPDGNGVYWTTNFATGLNAPICYEVDGGQIYFLSPAPGPSWTNGLQSAYWDGATNYVKTVTGNAPSNNMAMAYGGSWFNFNYQTNLTFLNLTFYDRVFQWGTEGYPGTTAANWTNSSHHITFKGCKFFFNQLLYLTQGLDYWTFDGCELGWSGIGIFSLFSYALGGCNYLTVTNCTIHDLYGTGADANGVGLQNCSEARILHNTFYNLGGNAIDFYGGGTNNWVKRNYIHDISGVGYAGCAIACDSGNMVPGAQTGFEICDNIIERVNVNRTYPAGAISFNVTDPILICNNTILYSDRGISVYSGSYPVQATVLNNIIAGVTNAALSFTGTGAPTLTTNCNLVWTNADLSALFRSANPSSVTDFMLAKGSPAIDAGTNAGLTTDFGGQPVPSWRGYDIGAWEYQVPKINGSGSLTGKGTLR